MNNVLPKQKIALMSYAMDNRRAKGTALYTRKLIEGLLVNDRYDFYLVHFDKTNDLVYSKTHEIIMPKVRLPFASHFVSLLLFFWKYRKEKFDIIHWFQPRVYPFYWLAPAKKIVVTVHGEGDITAPTRFVFSRFIFNIVLKYFHFAIDAIIVCSEHAKSEVVKYYKFQKEKVFCIYNGGGENFIQLDKAECQKYVNQKYRISPPYILDISRLIVHKNVARLIKAYDLLRKEHLEMTHSLVIVGSAMYEKDTIEYEIADASMFRKDILFIDYVDEKDLNSVYSGADLFVFPSLNEGFGLPVLEAMASGTPIITSNITSLPEIGGDAVLTIDPYKIEEIADAMYEMILNEEKKNQFILKGLERSREFIWNKTVEQTRKLYDSLN